MAADVSADAVEVLDLLRAARGRTYLAEHASAWRVWAAFCRVHRVDPDAPRDVDVVAFVHARALVGHSWSGIAGSLGTLVAGLDDSSVVVPAERHLTDLHDDGWFDVAAQAPVLTVGQVAAMIGGAESVRDAFCVAVTYLGGLRPDEWVEVGREDVEVTRYGRVRLLLPTAKTGRWQKVKIAPLPGTPFDVTALTRAWLAERGERPGPVLTRTDGRAGLSTSGVNRALRRAAAAAGVTRFSPYSLRRSMAVHANLLGVHGATIRARLRHAPGSQTWRRYVEPLLALLDPQALTDHYLSLAAPPVRPVPLARVRSGHGEPAPRYGFAAGSVPGLLAGVDVPALRVPAALARASRATIETGETTRRRFFTWARAQGYPGSTVPPQAVLRWLRTLADDGLAPATVHRSLASLRIGWLSAARDEPPGYTQAQRWVTGLVLRTARETRPEPHRYQSRPAQPGEVATVCAAAWAAVPAGPGERWAVRALAAACGARVTVEVLAAGDQTATVLADGRRRVVRRAPAGVSCPVRAAGWLIGRGGWAVPRRTDKAAVLAAAAPYTRGLLRAFVTTVIAGSGCRPSDLARARISGIEQHPGAWVVRQTTSKGRRPGRLGRGRVILAPARDGAADPFTAWSAWAAWWPVPEAAYLVPASVTRIVEQPHRRGQRTQRVAGRISALVRETIEAAGLTAAEGEQPLTAYGFRYDVTQAMWDAGASLEVLSELLGHESTDTTRVYLQNLDPFADGAAERLTRGLGKEPG